MNGLRHLAAIALVCLLGCVAYSNTLDVPFVFDDRQNVQQNPHIRLTSLRWDGLLRAALESPYHASFFGSLVLQDGAILAFGLRGHLFRSDDGGDTWLEGETNTEASLMGGAQIASDEIVLGGITGVLLRSRDGGRSFQSATRPDRKAVAGAVTLPGEKAVLFGAFGAEPFDASAFQGMLGSAVAVEGQGG